MTETWPAADTICKKCGEITEDFCIFHVCHRCDACRVSYGHDEKCPTQRKPGRDPR